MGELIIMIKLWNFIRTLSGDNAYENYLNNFRGCNTHGHKKPLSRKDFFHNQIQKKWNKINRCC